MAEDRGRQDDELIEQDWAGRSRRLRAAVPEDIGPTSTASPPTYPARRWSRRMSCRTCSWPSSRMHPAIAPIDRECCRGCWASLATTSGGGGCQRIMLPLPGDDTPAGQDMAVQPDPLLDLSTQRNTTALRSALLELPIRYREVIVLCDLQELNYADAARALGLRSRYRAVEAASRTRDARQTPVRSATTASFISCRPRDQSYELPSHRTIHRRFRPRRDERPGPRGRAHAAPAWLSELHGIDRTRARDVGGAPTSGRVTRRTAAQSGPGRSAACDLRPGPCGNQRRTPTHRCGWVRSRRP